MARGSIREKGPGKYELRVYQGVVDGVRRPPRSVTFKGTRRDADTALANLVVETQRGGGSRPSGAPNATVGSFLEEWFATFSGKWSESTRPKVRSIIKVHLVPGLGTIKLAKLDTRAIDKFIATKEGRYEASYVKRMRGVLHQALEVARKSWKLIPVNPCSDAASIEVVEREMDLWPFGKVLDILESEPIPEARLFFHLALLTGGRRGELTGLQWRDLESDGLWLRRRIIDGGPGVGLVVKHLTKGNRKGRHVEVDPLTQVLLDGHRLVMEARAVTCGTTVNDRAFIFSTAPDCSEPWRPDFFSHRWAKLRERSDLPKHLRLQDMRHQHASELIDSGLDIASVSKRLGHARTSTTLNIYSHRLEGADGRAADIMYGKLLARREH